MSHAKLVVEDVGKVGEEQDFDPVEIRRRTRKRVASYLRWAASLPQMEVDQRLEAVLRRFPDGAPMVSIKVLMDHHNDRDLVQRLLSLRCSQKIEVVYVVDTCLFGIGEEMRTRLCRAAQIRVMKLQKRHRVVRQGTRDEVLIRWKAE